MVVNFEFWIFGLWLALGYGGGSKRYIFWFSLSFRGYLSIQEAHTAMLYFHSYKTPDFDRMH